MNDVISIPQRQPRELNQGGTGTTETVFTSDGVLPVILPLPSDGKIAAANASAWAATGAGGPRSCMRFKVMACGRVTTGGSYTVTVKLYYGTSTTVGSDTAVASTGGVTVATTSANWQIEAQLVWDSDSNKIDGWYATSLNGTRVAPTIITAAITSADPDGNGTLGFVVSGTFGTGSASNKMYLDWFALSLG